MRLHLDETRIKRALNQNVLTATDLHFAHDDEFLIWHEKGNLTPNGEYLCTFKFDAFNSDTKIVKV